MYTNLELVIPYNEEWLGKLFTLQLGREIYGKILDWEDLDRTVILTRDNIANYGYERIGKIY